MQCATAVHDVKLFLKYRVPYKTILLKLVGHNAVYLEIAPGAEDIKK